MRVINEISYPADVARDLDINSSTVHKSLRHYGMREHLG